MKSWRSWLLGSKVLAAVFLASCGSTSPPPAAQLPLGPVSFRALYELACCGFSRLLVIVQAGEEGLLLQVASAPTGSVEAWWITHGQVWQRGPGPCLRPWAGESLTLAKGLVVPLAPEVLAALLSGRLPAAGEEVAPGLWELHQGQDVWRVRWVGGPPRWVEAWWQGEKSLWHLEASHHHGRLPGRIRISGPGQRLELTLKEFRPGAPPPPSWLQWPACESTP